MHRRRSALWIPLLAVLFGLAAARLPVVHPEAAALRRADLLSPAELQYTSPVRLQAAKLVRSQPIRHSGPPGDSLAAHPIPERQTPGSVHYHDLRVASDADGTDRHFPLFPTGPPARA